MWKKKSQKVTNLWKKVTRTCEKSHKMWQTCEKKSQKVTNLWKKWQAIVKKIQTGKKMLQKNITLSDKMWQTKEKSEKKKGHKKWQTCGKKS